MITVILPARNEQFLAPTIGDVISKAVGDIEVIAVLDGYWPDPPLKDYDNLTLIHRTQPLGMRPAINAAAAIAKGEYLFKLDAHCMVSEGFDADLAADCGDEWVVVPRRHRLDAENWCLQETKKPPFDYMYLTYPDNPADFGGPGLNGRAWEAKNRDESLKSVLIDDLMSAQGSGWFMKRDYFYKLELMDDANYGHFWNEFQEIGLKCWLSGGRVVRNKKCWYAHLHKGKKYGRGYFLRKSSLRQGAAYTKKWMIPGMAWDKQTKPLSWLIEYFWPVPSWTEDGLKKLKVTEATGKFS